MSCDLAPHSMEIVGHKIDKIQVSEKKKKKGVGDEVGIRDVLDFTAMAQQDVGSRHQINGTLTQSPVASETPVLSTGSLLLSTPRCGLWVVVVSSG